MRKVSIISILFYLLTITHIHANDIDIEECDYEFYKNLISYFQKDDDNIVYRETYNKMSLGNIIRDYFHKYKTLEENDDNDETRFISLNNNDKKILTFFTKGQSGERLKSACFIFINYELLKKRSYILEYKELKSDQEVYNLVKIIIDILKKNGRSNEDVMEMVLEPDYYLNFQK